jgi:imidazolonepropionase-like amidohydrolase
MIAALAPVAAYGQNLAIEHATVYPSPEAKAARDTTVLIQGGKIAAVGQHVPVPAGVTKIDCHGCAVFAGFWNAHVHFMEPKWDDAAHAPVAKLESQLAEMVLRSGFATVVDTGSGTANTVALRSRIESGEVSGPHIYTSGAPIFPYHALPYYILGLPPKLLATMGQPATPAEAKAFVRQNIAAGTTIVKLFTGSIVKPDHIVPMETPIARAAVEEAHAEGQLVFTHPSNLEGTRVALESGMDVLAHAPEATDGIDDAFLEKLVASRMSMIPTLKLFSQDSGIADIRRVVFRFHQLGGRLIFGTDTGFLTDYDIGEEYRQLSLAGLGFREITAMLTTAPAERFGVAGHQGKVAVGMAGDLTILDSDPETGGAAAFTKVRYTIRGGKVIYSRSEPGK